MLYSEYMNESTSPEPTFSIGSMFRFGWETFKQNPWMFLAILAIALIVSIASYYMVEALNDGDSFTTAAVTVLDLIVQAFIGLGLTAFALKAHDNIHDIHASDLWAPEHFWRYLGSSIAVTVIIGLGFIALVIPGLILMSMLVFAQYLVIDRKCGPIESLKESVRITKGYRWQLFFLILAVALLNVVGAVALFVGLLLTIPVSLLAMAHAYRTLERGVQSAVPDTTAVSN